MIVLRKCFFRGCKTTAKRACAGSQATAGSTAGPHASYLTGGWDSSQVHGCRVPWLPPTHFCLCGTSLMLLRAEDNLSHHDALVTPQKTDLGQSAWQCCWGRKGKEGLAGECLLGWAGKSQEQGWRLQAGPGLNVLATGRLREGMTIALK